MRLLSNNVGIIFSILYKLIHPHWGNIQWGDAHWGNAWWGNGLGL